MAEIVRQTDTHPHTDPNAERSSQTNDLASLGQQICIKQTIYKDEVIKFSV